ncbi:MAG TPA: hypothetical protein VJA21_10825, partial [Verrucomicrobiae bacterium]
GRVEAFLAPVATWLGHYHPVFIHLPIGGLSLVGLLEILALRSRFRGAAQHRSLLLALTVVGTIPAIVCGWFLSQSAGYDADLIRWHRWTGFGFLGASLATAVLSLQRSQRSYQVSLWGTILLLLVASHFGGSLTHGPDFLTLKLPARGEQPATPPEAMVTDSPKLAHAN